MPISSRDSIPFGDSAPESGFIRLAGHSIVRLKGRDRHRLLHSFCTADIKQLAVGHTSEAFLLDEKGKILWFCLVLAMEDQLILIGAGDNGAQIQKHLDRFVIREDVKVEDVSSVMAAIFVTASGATSGLTLQGLAASGHTFDSPPARNVVLQNHSAVEENGDMRCSLASVEIAGWGLLIVAHQSMAEQIEGGLRGVGLPTLTESELHFCRIQAGTPWYGIDMDQSNLPQEINRDDLAISFKKGCYLGQETVARIDALGHVNQVLVALDVEAAEEPKAGTEFQENGKVVGRLTSISPNGSRYLALGFVRRAFAEKGKELCFEGGRASVIEKTPIA